VGGHSIPIDVVQKRSFLKAVFATRTSGKKDFVGRNAMKKVKGRHLGFTQCGSLKAGRKGEEVWNLQNNAREQREGCWGRGREVQP